MIFCFICMTVLGRNTPVFLKLLSCLQDIQYLLKIFVLNKGHQQELKSLQLHSVMNPSLEHHKLYMLCFL